MPGVSVLPNSPGLGGFPSSHSTAQNGFTRFNDDMTVAEIKIKARETVQKEARGASAMSLIKAARTQFLLAKEHEMNGDLKSALGTFTKAASLAKMAMDSTEFVAEAASGRTGLLRKEFTDFWEHDGSDLKARLNAVEEKLKTIEKSNPSLTGAESDDGPNHKSGGSIADRVRALQDNGLTVGTPKRFPRELPKPPSPTTSSHRFSTQGMSSPSISLSSLAPSAPVSSSPSPHAFVSPSTLGPPSPSSTPSSSPQLAQFNLSEFAQAFPSIDELDQGTTFTLPSAPGPNSIGSNKSSPRDYRNGDSPGSSSAAFRTFTVPIDRPSSTPITPIVNSFASRPASPTKSPTLKQPSLSVNAPYTPPSGPTTPNSDKPPIPKTNMAYPKELLEYMRIHKVLLLDVRNRADFEREHIKAGAVVCVEPSVLMRENVTGEMLEDSMVIAPKHEGAIFGNREKFDLVAVYDESSQSFGPRNSPLSVLVGAISEYAFRKILKRMPMMLVGGIEAWRREVGDAELIRGSPEMSFPEPQRPLPPVENLVLRSPGLSTASSKNPFVMNGMVSSSPPSSDPHQVWTPRPRDDTGAGAFDQRQSMPDGHRPPYSLDHASYHSRSAAEVAYPNDQTPDGTRQLVRRHAISRASISVSPSPYTRSLSDNIVSQNSPPQSMVNGISYPQFPRRGSPTIAGPGSPFVSSAQYDIASPPLASINPSLSRRRSDYVDQSQEALSGLAARPSIDYPELSAQHILRPPPVAASSALERQDNRPRVPHTQPYSGSAVPTPPRISSDYPVTYWSDIQIGTSGLKNLGNTCYMNAPIQCLSATVPFARFFTDGRWKIAVNYTNTFGSQGKLAGAFAKLLHEMWHGDLPYLTPIQFRKSICQMKAQYNGSDQHDSQEFLSFLLDGIHEDLNRILSKPVWAPTPEQEAELERLPQQIASDQEWRSWRTRNDSLIVDFFQGQFRNRLECLTCHQTSTTYNVFSILQLPIPHGRNGKVSLQRCLDAFFSTEVMEKADAWDCPRCKVKRKATKRLSLARLPPILLIHLKRFEANGRFSDKIDTFVDFPLKSLDLTNFMPPPLPPGADKGQLNGGLPLSLDDPRTQLPPYKYDLYGVTNHYGNLSSGHYTAFIASRGGWMYCDDSSVRPVDAKQVVSQRAYVLFYKRTRA